MQLEYKRQQQALDEKYRLQRERMVEEERQIAAGLSER
jgi:hypothetical protein